MLNILVVFGGKSVEHDVSIITGRQVLNNIDKKKYNVIPVYIDKNGEWWTGKNMEDTKRYLPFKPSHYKRIYILPGNNDLYIGKVCKKRVKIDCALICCHGTDGEDGCLQGLFNLIHIPFSGSNVLGSAICMNKKFMKILFEYFELPIVKYETYIRSQILDAENTKLNFPLIVKPCNLGSSIGISKVSNTNELYQALELAFEFDHEAIVEECVQSLREINCSVQKINGEIITSDLEEPISWENILSFNDKYLGGGKKQKRNIKVKLPKKLEATIKEISKLCYEKFELNGVIRIDFMIDNQTKQIFVNEINTIPGSLSFYLWQGKQFSFREHIDLQIDQAIQKNALKLLNQTNFESKLLDQNVKQLGVPKTKR